jgi:hypothetical protein
LAIDRFSALWHTETVQSRLATHWYKEVWKIDCALEIAAAKLKASSHLPYTHAVLTQTFATIATLLEARTGQKAVESATNRNKRAGSVFYIQGIAMALAACRKFIQDQGAAEQGSVGRLPPLPSDLVTELLGAIANYPVLADPEGYGASSLVVGVAPAGCVGEGVAAAAAAGGGAAAAAAAGKGKRKGKAKGQGKGKSASVSLASLQDAQDYSEREDGANDRASTPPPRFGVPTCMPADWVRCSYTIHSVATPTSFFVAHIRLIQMRML